MRVSCIQMDMHLGCPEENFPRAASLIAEAARQKPDVIVLPETWNTGFFPRENLETLCDWDGQRTKAEIGALAARYQVHIVAGSVSNRRGGRVYNTAMVFDRAGSCVVSYDKTHLFSPMGENDFYTPGDTLCRFTLDGLRCALVICYDIRFPELIRRLVLPGLDMLFVVSQWPETRISHLQTLIAARAIENQMFVVCCNSCGTAGEVRYGGCSAVLDPWGQSIAAARAGETILQADCDPEILQRIHATIPVFRDRRPELYRF